MKPAYLTPVYGYRAAIARRVRGGRVTVCAVNTAPLFRAYSEAEQWLRRYRPRAVAEGAAYVRECRRGTLSPVIEGRAAE